MYVCFGQGYGVGWGSGGGVCVCVFVCAFGSVILTLNPTLTQFPNPDYCSVHSAVQNGTPNRCGPMSNESESRENMNPTFSHGRHVPLRDIATPWTCLYTFAESDPQVFKSCALGGTSLNAFEQWRDCKKRGQNCGGGISWWVVHGRSRLRVT